MIKEFQTPRAIIFDLDGTLLNTLEDVAFAMNTVLSNNNYPTYPVNAYRSFIGGGLFNVIRNTIPEHAQIPQLLNLYHDALVKEYIKCIDMKTKPYDGIAEMLDGLSGKNIPLAILSNKAHEFMDGVVKTHFSQWKFKAVFGARAAISPKPDPYAALEIASIMNIAPQEIAFLGDTDVDMQTAANAKMYGIGAAWGFRTVDELHNNGAQMIIDHPIELLKLFN
ncbi:MAG: HAD family hydrolase [Burkholderiales bacterium]|nr:HAD family hydrolase [Burkholderiales bacterium]